MSALCAAGESLEEMQRAMGAGQHALQFDEGLDAYVGAFPQALREKLKAFAVKHDWQRVDPTVLQANYVAEKAVADANWSDTQDGWGIAMASSRGATQLWEQYYNTYRETGAQGMSPLTSPLTTLGNLSSNVAAHLGKGDMALSHSMTCSSALHGIINAVAWMRAGLVGRCVVGATEAPLTPFSIDQFKALRIYSAGGTWPCRPFGSDGQNSMVLGEGAAAFCLDFSPENAIAKIEGMGFALESVKHPVYISKEGEALQRSMLMAMGGWQKVEAIMAHAPGTAKGDAAEKEAIRAVFGHRRPPVVSNKWAVGHTLGASGALSLYLSIAWMRGSLPMSMPHLEKNNADYPEMPASVLVNATGFGGNAASLLISRV